MKKLLMILGSAVDLTAKALTALVAVAVASAAAARDAKYAAPYWTMGHYDVGSPQSFSAVVTNAPTLAFKNMTLAELKMKLDGGYSIFGQAIGSPMAGARTLGQFYNVQYYPASGTPIMIVGDFATKDVANVKGVCVKFSENGGNVYVEFLIRSWQSVSKADLTYKFITLDTNGNITYTGVGQKTNYANAWDADGYGVAAVQLAKFLPSGSPALVFADAKLADLADVLFTASIGGQSAETGCRCIESSRTATESAIDVTLKQTGGDISVTVRLTEGDGGVYAQAMSAADGASALAVAGSFADAGLCVWGLTALEPAYETAARTTYTAATQGTVPKGSSILIWSGATLDDIKDCWFSCNVTGNMTKNGIEGRGCNRKITYDAEGAAAKLRVQFQTHDHTYIKTVIVDMTNGVDGVYATKVFANYVNASSYAVGYNASETGSSGYYVCNLTATPCVTLEADEDWTGHSSLACGDAVIDLNGHELSVRGIECVNAAIGKVVNTKTATTATLRIDVPSGATYTNGKVDIGYSSAGYSTPLTYSCLATDNIRVVKDGAGVYVAQAKSEYSGGTVVNAGTFTVDAPLSTAMTLVDGATLGFLLSQGVQSPLLTLGAASSFPATFDVAVGRSNSFKIPRDGFALTDGFSFTGKTATLSNPSDFARKVKVDGDGNLVVAGRSGFQLIVK